MHVQWMLGGNRSETVALTLQRDATPPSVPAVIYNGGSNTCSWKNNYNISLNSTDNASGISRYQASWWNNGNVDFDRSKCTNCLACYDVCPSDAVKKWGKRMSVEDCMNEILKDKGYYDSSGGGVTLSGGDPLVQADFAAELMKACKEEEIHTCFESTFYGEWKEVEKILPFTDLIISDIKHMDSDIHKKHTGVHNEKILENLKRLADENREMILRIPVIPNVNDDAENLEATADFILNEMQGRVRTLQLLSFMRLGEEKYTSLDLPYKMEGVKVNRRQFQKHVSKIADYFNSRGIHCLVGTKEKE